MDLLLEDVKVIISVSDFVFGCKFNKSLVHQVVVAYASRARQGTHHQKSRSDVKGSKKKPWRQKGTGRARSGSVKSPIWRSGGVTFASRPKDYSKKINKKMYRGALRSIFSNLIEENKLIAVEKFSVELPKTTLLKKKLDSMKLSSALIITEDMSKNLILSSRNLNKIHICNVSHISPIDLIKFDKVVMTTDSIRKVEGILI